MKTKMMTVEALAARHLAEVRSWRVVTVGFHSAAVDENRNRRYIKSETGAGSMFVQGACGDLVPKEDELGYGCSGLGLSVEAGFPCDSAWVPSMKS